MDSDVSDDVISIVFIKFVFASFTASERLNSP